MSQPTTPLQSGEPKSKIVAGLLGIFLGSLGIHRFYLGYTTIGIIQIVVTVLTFGIGGLWGFVEGILIFAGTINKDAQGRPLKD
jgi:TM2 domain-containing membrane protein YozV